MFFISIFYTGSGTRITILHILLFRILYAVFVVSSENATVAELASTLQADLAQLQAAASFACRLGWAVKVFDPASVLQDAGLPGSPRNSLSDEDPSHRSTGSRNMFADGDATIQGDASGRENYGPVSSQDRVAFVVDANITSYLMMGSVSPGLYLLLNTRFVYGTNSIDKEACICSCA